MSGAALELVEQHQQLKVPLGASAWYLLLEASSSLPGLRDVTENLRDADAMVHTYYPGARVNAFGHAGDGNILYNVIVPPGMDAKD